MSVVSIAARSVWNRRTTAALTVASIAISVTLLLSVRLLNEQARTAFTSTISGTDLIVGGRSGEINLLLYSVFRLGSATSNVSWEFYERLARHRDVSWAVPLALGDSHRGFRVLGTTPEYFERYRFAGERRIELGTGRPFADLYDAVVGSQVARELGYRVGDKIIIAHGAGSTSFALHQDKPFTIVGVLMPTGTPIDRTVHVSLEAIEAIHLDWQSGAQAPASARISAEEARRADLTPDSVTAILVGLESKLSTFQMQRGINEYRDEPLLAILPGVALQNLWNIVGVVEKMLTAVAVIVVAVGLLCLMTAILASLNERRREMAVLRSVGARPLHVFGLLVSEAALLALIGVLSGAALTYLVFIALRPIAQSRYGVLLQWPAWSSHEAAILAGILCAAVAAGAIPAWQAYRHTLADGLTVRL